MRSWWLLVVAGCRLGDSLTDITCLLMCEKYTTMALLAFPMAGLGNLLIGVTLIQFYRSLEKETLKHHHVETTERKR